MNKDISSDHEIYDLLLRLGFTPHYTGFFYIAHALQLTTDQPQRLNMVTKWVYPDMAKHFKTTPAAVERDIRVAISKAWQAAPEQLRRIAEPPLAHRPTNGEFLALLTVELLSKCR